MAINVISNFRNKPQMTIRDGFIAYPAPGYFPFALLPISKRWLFWPVEDRNYIVVSSAIVTVSGPSGLLPVVIPYKGFSEGMGPLVVFEVQIPPSNKDEVYHVTISGLIVVPSLETVSYDVIIFNT